MPSHLATPPPDGDTSSPLASPSPVVHSAKIVCTLFRQPLMSHVHTASSYNFFGSVARFLNQLTASQFIARVTDASASDFQDLLTNFISAAHGDCPGKPHQKAAMWISIRVSKPTDAFRVPRWHQDGKFFTPDPGSEDAIRLKYAVTVLGPPTRLLEWKGVVEDYVGCEEWWKGQDPDKPERVQIAKKFESAKEVKVEPGQLLRFVTGRDNGTVHSEPDINTDRVFMSVLFASENELRDMCSKWEEEYQA